MGYTGLLVKVEFEEIVLGVYWFAEGVFCLMVGEISPSWKDSTIF